MDGAEIRVFGIDLGTTYSCIARVDPAGRPEVIFNFEGDPITPSVVLFDGEQRIVGGEAKNHALVRPGQVIEMVKTQMGAQTSEGHAWRFPYEGVDYSPEEISSFIIQKVVKDAESQLGFPITDVVITCPAYFGLEQKEATKRAGLIAGLNVMAIIVEPVAAAIASELQDGSDRVFVVYDLGGGTFDVTLVEVKGGALSVITTDGDHHLGGRQWDELIVNYCAEQWMEKTGSSQNPLDEPEVQQELFQKVEQGKKGITARGKADVAVSYNGQRELVSVTRETFDSLTSQLLEQTIELTRQMLSAAKAKGYDSFESILLVGGSTKMPQVKERLEAEFPGKDVKSFDPDQAVAKGAAIYAYKMRVDQLWETRFKDSEGGLDDMAAYIGMQPGRLRELADSPIPTIVTSRSFGVEAIHDIDGREMKRITNLIKLNDQLPAEGSSTFGTYSLNQPGADLRYFENLASETTVDPDETSCIEIGSALLTLPANLPKGSPIEITFRLDEQGLLHATGREMTQNRIVDVEIKTAAGMSPEELAAATERSRSGQIVVS